MFLLFDIVSFPPIWLDFSSTNGRENSVIHRDNKPGHTGILVGGCVLAMLAAAVNADLLIRLGISVSHLTGDLSRINTEAIRSGRHGSAEAGLLALTIAGFVTGATASGYFIHHPSLDTSRPYGRSIVMIGLLLLIVSFTTGSAIGAILNLRHHQSLLLLCGAAYVSGGILWSWIKRRPTQSPSNPSDHE